MQGINPTINTVMDTATLWRQATESVHTSFSLAYLNCLLEQGVHANDYLFCCHCGSTQGHRQGCCPHSTGTLLHPQLGMLMKKKLTRCPLYAALSPDAKSQYSLGRLPASRALRASCNKHSAWQSAVCLHPNATCCASLIYK